MSTSPKRVVLVLGAGASHPYGFPLGADLVRAVLTTPVQLYPLLGEAGVDHGQIRPFCDALRASQTTVDRFLEHQKVAGYDGFTRVGKALIALAISQCENSGDLHDESSGPAERGARWYRYIFDRLLGNPSPVGLLDSPHISIITFNYDRSLEFSCLRVLQSRFRLSPEDALVAMRRLRIIHVHGSLGGSPADADDYCEYGPANTPERLVRCIEGIRIVHEVDPHTPEWSLARDCLRMASHVVFLGFGYLASNLQRLQLDEQCRKRLRRDPERADMLRIAGISDSAVFMGTRRGFENSEFEHDVSRVLGLAVHESAHFLDTDVLGWLRKNVAVLERQ